MKHCTYDKEINQVATHQPLFTARDTCVGLAACLGVGLLTSLALSIIILFLSANAQAQDKLTASFVKSSSHLSSETNSLNIIDFSTPESIISQKCDADDGQLRNINIGDELTSQNEGSMQQLFRITGIQIVDEQPEVMPVVDESSMLTMITCYPANHAKKELTVSYLVMIQEITPSQDQNQDQVEQGLSHVLHMNAGPLFDL